MKLLHRIKSERFPPESTTDVGILNARLGQQQVKVMGGKQLGDLEAAISAVTGWEKQRDRSRPMPPINR